MVLYGWDASDFDWGRGPMDLASAKSAGVSFFTYKATESTNVRHVHYGEALNRAKAAGIEFLGAYIVPRSGPSVAAQVDYFLAYVNSATPWWTSYPGFFFQVDTEKWSYDAVSSQRGAEVCALLRARTNRQVVHYAPQWAYGNTIPQPDPLWASSYGDNGVGTLAQKYPGDSSSRWGAYSGRVPTFLQFGSRIVIGRQSTCDGNAFRGTRDQLFNLINPNETPTKGEILMFMAKTVNDAAVRLSDGFRWKGLEFAPFNSLRTAGVPLIVVADVAALDKLCGAEWAPADALSSVDVAAVEEAAKRGAVAGLNGATATIQLPAAV